MSLWKQTDIHFWHFRPPCETSVSHELMHSTNLQSSVLMTTIGFKGLYNNSIALVHVADKIKLSFYYKLNYQVTFIEYKSDYLFLTNILLILIGWEKVVV